MQEIQTEELSKLMRIPRSFTKCCAAGIAGLAFVLLSGGAQAAPLFVASPSEGQELDNKLTIIFTQAMEEEIAVSFSGAGDAEFGCGWLVVVEGQPLQFLECELQSGELPSGATVTWTINPGGEGMTTVGGTVIPEFSGTFTTPVVTDVTISVSPDDGATYDPELDGPVVFTFNVPMSQSVPAVNAVTFDKGDWNIVWLVNRTMLQCILSGDAEPGVYGYTISGLTSAEGATAPQFSGGFTIGEDPTGGGGDVEIFPSPGEGEMLTSTPGLPTKVRFIFSHPMDPSVDLDTAVTFSMGEWDCIWTQILPSLPVNGCECAPVGSLPGGTYDYTLSGLKTEQGGTVPDFMGTFVVSGPGTGGGEITGGTPAPDCLEDGLMLGLPKSLYVCGSEMFSWFGASVVPAFRGGGFVVDASADVTGGTLSSLLLLDDEGAQIGGVTATDVLVRLDGWPAQNLVLVTEGGTPIQPDVSLGLFDLSSGTSVSSFQHKIAATGDDVTTSFLPDGRVYLVRESNDVIELIVFDQDGTVDWAKRFTSAAFGVDPSTGTSSQSAQLTPLEGGGFQMVVSKREIEVDINAGNATATRTASVVITQLSNNGTVQWSRVYTSNDELDSLNVSGPFEDGSIILSGSLSEGTSTSSSTTATLAKLASSGTVTWAKKVEGSFLSAMGVTSTGRILVGGGRSAGLGTDMLFMMMGLTGNIENQLIFDISDIDVGFATISDDRIYFSVITSEIPSFDPNAPQVDTTTSQTAIIGSSSLSLSGFQWKQYFRPVSTAFLGVNFETSELSFSAFREDTHRLDAVKLTRDLTATADCELFTDITVTPQNSGLTALNTTIVSSNAQVTATDFSPELLPADIGVTDLTVAEADICEDGETGGGDCDAPVSLTIAESSTAGMVTIGFTTVSGCSHTLQRSVSLGPVAVWIPVEVISGTGAAYSGEFALGAGTEFYRVVSQD